MTERGTVMDRRRALVVALLIGCATMWLTGAIPRWGQWYSPQPYYRAQVHALLHGRLALSDDPGGLALDLAWVDGGVHQVWGLGVPLWLALWEAIGRVIHLTPFPDRVAMWLGAVAMFYALARAWWGPGGDRSAGSRGAFLFTALLPGVVTMLRGHVGVYEEAALYAYGTAMLLLAGVIAMIRRPSSARYVVLVAFAGATGLVRPTVWFYGAATAAIATALYVRHRGSIRRALGPAALAIALFLAGGGALYATNLARFGSGGEFGHRLNLEDGLSGNLYATRFAYPFAAVAWPTAAVELIGGLFGRPEEALHRERYDRRIHPGQAGVPRWREYYFTTYTWPYLALVIAGLAWTAIAWAAARRAPPSPAATPMPRDGPDLARETRWLGAWAVLGGAPLVVFYLHSPSVASRYFLDLAPAIAVLLVTAWRHAVALVEPAASAGPRSAGEAVGLPRWRRWLACAALAGLALWWGSSALGFRIRRSGQPPLGQAAARQATLRVIDPRPVIPLIPPGAYDLDDPELALYLPGDRWQCRCYADVWGEAACDHAGLLPGSDVELVPADQPRWFERRIAPAACTDGAADGATIESRLVPPALYGNGTTWDRETGAVGVATYLFADDPAYVEVEVAPRPGAPRRPDLAPQVRAKLGLEELPLVAMASTARGVRLRFAGPRAPRDRRGLQVIFLAFGPPAQLDAQRSEYTLLRVAWRDPRQGER